VADNQDPMKINERAMEIVAPIAKEMRDRLLVAPGDQDVLAITTALLKAFVTGMHLGTTETTAQVIEQSDSRTHVTLDGRQLDEQLARFDLWAEKYG
jgi:hypothetical protein